MDRYPAYDVVQRLTPPPLTVGRALRIGLEFLIVAAVVIVAIVALTTFGGSNA